jgi:hypothetical protein
MLLFRSLTVGLLAACAYLLADLPAVHTHTVRTVEARPFRTPPPANQVTVVDVARGVEPSTIFALLRLGDGEGVVSIDDHPTHRADAPTRIADEVHAGARHLDLTVARGPDAADTRRVLVLFH